MKISVVVSNEIFNSPKIKTQIDRIFEENKDLFKNRFDEIYNYLMSIDSHKNCSVISAEEVFAKFRDIFLEKVAVIATENAFSTDNHDLESNLINVLSREWFEKALKGHTMIEAFADVIRNLPTKDALEKSLNGGAILMLNDKYLGINPFTKSSNKNLERIEHYIEESIEKMKEMP